MRKEKRGVAGDKLDFGLWILASVEILANMLEHGKFL